MIQVTILTRDRIDAIPRVYHPRFMPDHSPLTVGGQAVSRADAIKAIVKDCKE